PGALAGGADQAAGAGGIFVLYRDGGANQARFLHGAPEPDEVRVRYQSMGNVDGEIIARVARPRSSVEREIPGPVIGLDRGGSVSRGDPASRDQSRQNKPLHDFF